MKHVLVQEILHKRQRYNTVGDYQEEKRLITFRISKTKNKWDGYIVFIHEFVEKVLCMKRGIKDKTIDEFDIEFEKRDSKHSEPGLDPACPYFREHVFATKIEKMLVADLGLNWDEYEYRLDLIYSKRKKKERRRIEKR